MVVFVAVWSLVCVVVGYQVGARSGKTILVLDEVGKAVGRCVRGEEVVGRAEGKVKEESGRLKV
jgi:hypothetical protein